MSAKTILIAHRTPAVRDRFAAALADARHTFVMAESAEAAVSAARDASAPVSLALIDLGMAEDGLALVKALRDAAGRQLPVVVFAGTVVAATQVAALLSIGVSGYVNEHAATPQILPSLAPHLFPDNFNRRTSLRVALGVPVLYRAGPTIAGSVTVDVGKGGLGIRTINPLDLGTLVQLKFRLPGGTADIETAGRVAWIDHKVGMGVQFDRISGDDQSAIDAFVDGHG